MQSFAQMTPKQLLEESERALADGKYYQIHQELVEETRHLEGSERVTICYATHAPQRPQPFSRLFVHLHHALPHL